MVGRKEEIRILENVKKADKSAFVAVYGRRRVGKTFLIRSVFEGQFSFQLTGMANTNLRQQLVNFHASLLRQFPAVMDAKPVAKDWFNAFQYLITCLEKSPDSKKIVFLDELPWLDTPQSFFLSTLEHFWNSWASARRDVLLIVCGSAASWMIGNLLNNHGGLHNRVTHRIQLDTFTLQETELYHLQFFRMKHIFILLFLLSAGLRSLSAQCWSLVWQDNFDGTALNTNDWTHYTGPIYNNELQAYTNRPENVKVENGVLKLIARKEAYNGSSYTSGRIDTRQKVDFTYGRVEGRMKLVNEPGLWPAFWMLPTAGGWPDAGEIDIMELLGQTPNKTYGTLHYAANGIHQQLGSDYVLPTGNFAEAFHLFAMEWAPTTVKWFVDGTLYHTITKNQVGAANWPFKKDFFVILNLAVGGDWPGNPNPNSTAFPITMEVDYVKIFQTNPYIKIKGPTTVEPGTNKSYQLPTWAGGTYNWSLTGGTIASGQGTPNVVVHWNNNTAAQTLSCAFHNDCGNRTTTLSVTVTPNLWSNPSFEDKLVGWDYGTSGPPANATFASVASATAPEGARNAKVMVYALGNNFWEIQLKRLQVPVKKDTSYTLRFWAKSNVSGKKTQVNFLNPTNYTNYAWKNITLTTAWTQYQLVFVAPYTGDLLFTQDFGFHTGNFYLDNYSFGRTSLYPFAETDIERSSETSNPTAQQSSNFQLQPNPFTEDCWLTAPPNAHYTVINLAGKRILKGNVGASGKQPLPFSGQPMGLYWVKIVAKNGYSQTLKIVKLRP